MDERTLGWVSFRFDHEARRPELHLDDRVLPIAPFRRRRKARDIPCLDRGEYALERDSRNMMALDDDDDVPVGGHEILNRVGTNEALQHRHVELSVECASHLRCDQSPYFRFREIGRVGQSTGREAAVGKREPMCSEPARR